MPQTPSLPHARPESLGLSPARLERMFATFKREAGKVTIPSVTVLVARHGQINWFDVIGRQNRIESREMFWR